MPSPTSPMRVAQTIELALGTGLAGGSVEDYDGIGDTIYDADLAGEHVRRRGRSRARGSVHFVLTARAENYLHGRRDLPDTIALAVVPVGGCGRALARPGLTDLAEIGTLVAAVDLPVNVLALPDGPTVGELAAAGVRRVSIGGAFRGGRARVHSRARRRSSSKPVPTASRARSPPDVRSRNRPSRTRGG